MADINYNGTNYNRHQLQHTDEVLSYENIYISKFTHMCGFEYLSLVGKHDHLQSVA